MHESNDRGHSYGGGPGNMGPARTPDWRIREADKLSPVSIYDLP